MAVRTKSPFLERLQQGPLLCDGGMGTELYARGVSYEQCFEQLNLTSAELIKSIHMDYVAAGAQIIETNTFGANRYRLAEHGLEHAVYEINRAGAKIAREVRDLCEMPIFLAGNIGPLGVPLAPIGQVTALDAYTAFKEQAEALLKTGVDLFLLETFSDVREIQAALKAVRSISDLPVVALMTFAEDNTVASGQAPGEIVRMLQEQGADIVGANCALGPAGILDVLLIMRRSMSKESFVGVQPNAGLPRRVGNRFIYVATPEYFADYTRQFLHAGARLIGGCCGTTPQHIAAMKKAMQEFAPQGEDVAAAPMTNGRLQAIRERRLEVVEAQESEDLTHFAHLLQEKRFVVSVEMGPPRSVKFTRFLQNATRIRESGADIINITDNAMARVRMSNIAAARLIQQYVGMETLVHFTPRDRNLMAIQSDVIGAHATDIRNMLIVTGDPPTQGDFPNATGIWDVDSIGLIAMLHNLNQGLDARGKKLAAASSFFIGCAANPTADDVETDIERLKRKIDSGAQYILTQPVFDAGLLRDYVRRYEQSYGEISIPILAGLQPLHSYQQAEKFHNEVPGIVIPELVRYRLRDAGERAGQIGIEIAQELFAEIHDAVQGVYMMPLDRFELVDELLPYIRRLTAVEV